MKCNSCGEELSKDIDICPKCGNPLTEGKPWDKPQKNKRGKNGSPKPKTPEKPWTKPGEKYVPAKPEEPKKKRSYAPAIVFTIIGLICFFFSVKMGALHEESGKGMLFAGVLLLLAAFFSTFAKRKGK